VVANHFFELAISEGISGCILGFDDSVGLEQQAVAGLKRESADRILGVRQDAKR
jgi:hypothetical protein